MIAPIILPEGTVPRWGCLDLLDTAESWDEFAIDMLDDAVREPDPRIKDDILLLVLVACERANQAGPGLPFDLTIHPLKEAA